LLTSRSIHGQSVVVGRQIWTAHYVYFGLKKLYAVELKVGNVQSSSELLVAYIATVRGNTATSHINTNSH